MKRNFFIAAITCFTLFIGLVSFAPEKNAACSGCIHSNQSIQKIEGKAELIIRNDLNNICSKT
jgi:hypothetical protein